MEYATWRATYQCSEQAARAAFEEVGRLRVLVEAAYREGWICGFTQRELIPDSRLWEQSAARRALADTAAPAAQQEGE